jgi:hypothetical protein
MSSFAMTKNEREAFLADVYVGIISVVDPVPNRAPLAAPIWYDYDPQIGLWFLTSPDSRKGKAIKAAGRCTMTVQIAQPPHRYVTVEGPVIEARIAKNQEDLLPMARRYKGTQGGDEYAALYGDEPGAAGSVYVMRPEHWLTADYSKSR